MTSPTTENETTVLPATPGRFARLPLCAELFLIAHHDDTGRAHIDPRSLEIGLAGALLIELVLTGRVVVGFDRHLDTGQWRPQPGCISITDSTRIGNDLADAAFVAAEHVRSTPTHDQLRTWLRRFRAGNLYNGVRADLLTAGVLHRVTRRRYAFLCTNTYLPVRQDWTIRIRGQIRDTLLDQHRPPQHRYHRPDQQLTALCSLTGILDLAAHLHLSGLTHHQIRVSLDGIVAHEHHAIREILDAVDTGREELATAALD